MPELKYRLGNLIEAARVGDVDVIAHQANCFCVGRSGIAPKIFEAFPSMKDADNNTKRGDRSKLGDLSFGVVDRDRPMIGFNLYGQYHFLKKHPEYGTRYEALYNALVRMRFVLDKRIGMYYYEDDPINVGFPLIGCGLAGGDWEKVSSLIKQAFEQSRYCIYIYTLEPLEGYKYESDKSNNQESSYAQVE